MANISEISRTKRFSINNDENNLEHEVAAKTEAKTKRKFENPSLKKPNKKSKRELYKPPTAEELNQLKETENLFNSNLFRLQIDELLSEVDVKEKLIVRFDSWFKQFQSVVENFSEYENISVSDIKEFQSNKPHHGENRKFIEEMATICNISSFKCDQELNLKFLKPQSYKLVGLHSVRCSVGPELDVNISVTMPKACFYEKDYLNNRYLMKRYYYLMYIAAEFSRTGTNICSQIDTYDVNSTELLPILMITPNVSNRIKVHIFVTPPSDYFPVKRFMPDKNNFKLNLDNDEEHNLGGTPLYNSILLHDITLSENNAFYADVLKDFKNAKDGLKLLIVWLKQRGLYNIPGLSEEFLLHLMTYLILKRHINKLMSSYQVIRNVWLFISKSEWHNKPISISGDIKENTYEQFKKHFDVVFLDKSGCNNLTAFLNLETYLKLKSESTLAMQYLDNDQLNSFDLLFMTKLPFILQYDMILRLNSEESFKNVYGTISNEEKHRFVGFYKTLIIKKIIEILKIGLNKRVSHLVPYFGESKHICLTENKKSHFDHIVFGISLNVDHAFNAIELGPHPHDPKVKEFIDFWEDLTNLRRFPDGTTCEAVYFETKTIKDRRDIIKTIVSFVASKKLKIIHRLYFDQFEGAMMIKNLFAPFQTGTNEEATLKIITVSDDLSRKLRSLELPLEITGVLGNCDVYSYTDLFPTIPTNYKWDSATTVKNYNIMLKEDIVNKVPQFISPIECVIQLSLHSKWPSSLEATRHIKTAFLLKMSQLLKKQFNMNSNVAREYLDVFYEGLVFRYKIYHPKEVALLKKNIRTDGVVTYTDNEDSLNLEKQLNIKPKITGALKGIQSQHPSYGPSTALAKRWLRSQMLDGNHVSDIVINLLNASLYLNSTAYLPPALPQIAFLRFLKFISETDWNTKMVVVNFNEELKKDRLDEIETNFHQRREEHPPLFIVIPYDDGKSLLTKTTPTKEILRRVAILAGESCKIVCSDISSILTRGIMPFFTANLEGYSVVIHLKPELNPRGHQHIKFKYRKKMQLEEYNSKESYKIPVVNFSPVDLFLRELRKFYGNFALFFHDTYGGNVIGVLWKPSVFEAVDFKVSQVGGRKLTNGKLTLNVDAVIEDFYVLGQGVVENIENK